MYDVFFKLTDLTPSKPDDREEVFREDVFREDFGTSAYGKGNGDCKFRTDVVDDDIGPPETWADPLWMESLPHQVRGKVDIWSIGCVFSEAAVWSRFGWRQLLEYRQRRQSQGDFLMNAKSKSVFHDGRHVLNIVTDTHEQIMKEARSIDQVITGILPMINDMLSEEATSRPTARQVLHKCRRVIKAVEAGDELPLFEEDDDDYDDEDIDEYEDEDIEDDEEDEDDDDDDDEDDVKTKKKV